jgi:hypothetical protein
LPKSNTTFDLGANDRSDRISFSLREAAPAWVALLALTALAWIVTLEQAQAMGNGAGTMGMSIVAFVAMWTAMMAAMMFPSMAPVAILWTRSILRQRWNAVAYGRIALFAFGYLLAWALVGVFAFFGLALFEQTLLLTGKHGRWLGAAIFCDRRDLPIDVIQGRLFAPLPLADEPADALYRFPRTSNRYTRRDPSRSLLYRVLLGLDVDFGRCRRHEHSGNGCPDNSYFCRENVTPWPADRSHNGCLLLRGECRSSLLAQRISGPAAVLRFLSISFRACALHCDIGNSGAGGR